MLPKKFIPGPDGSFSFRKSALRVWRAVFRFEKDLSGSGELFFALKISCAGVAVPDSAPKKNPTRSGELLNASKKTSPDPDRVQTTPDRISTGVGWIIFTPKKCPPGPDTRRSVPDSTIATLAQDIFEAKIWVAALAPNISRAKMWNAGPVQELFRTKMSVAAPATDLFETKFQSADPVQVSLIAVYTYFFKEVTGFQPESLEIRTFSFAPWRQEVVGNAKVPLAL